MNHPAFCYNKLNNKQKKTANHEWKAGLSSIVC